MDDLNPLPSSSLSIHSGFSTLNLQLACHPTADDGLIKPLSAHTRSFCLAVKVVLPSDDAIKSKRKLKTTFGHKDATF